MKRILYLLLLQAMIFLTPGCHRSDQPANQNEALRVRVEKARSTSVHSKQYIGTLTSSITIALSFPVSGMVREVLITEGEPVCKGQLLASLDTESYRNALDIAEAKKKQAEDAWQRISGLYQKESVPEIKYVEVKTGLDQARATAQLARKNLADCRLTAPLDGIIGEREIEPGENAIPYKTVLTLVNTDRLDVKVSVPEKEIASIRTRDQAKITVPAIGESLFHGNVISKGVVAQPISHTYDILIRIREHNPMLLPGMVCRVNLSRQATDSVALVPIEVVQTSGDGTRYLFVPDPSGKKVIRKKVSVGNLQGLYVEIMDGLHPGDLYIADGYQLLDTTMNIQIVH